MWILMNSCLNWNARPWDISALLSSIFPIKFKVVEYFCAALLHLRWNFLALLSVITPIKFNALIVYISASLSVAHQIIFKAMKYFCIALCYSSDEIFKRLLFHYNSDVSLERSLRVTTLETKLMIRLRWNHCNSIGGCPNVQYVYLQCSVTKIYIRKAMEGKWQMTGNWWND